MGTVARLAVVLAWAGLSACSILTGGDPKIDEGVVIAPKLTIRSSTALAALALAEVKRGDRIDIIEEKEVKTPTRTNDWYKVRTKTKDQTEGWVEARYVINKSIVDKTNELFEKSKSIPSQGTGRLKVQTKLRMEAGGDVIHYLSRGTSVEIVGKTRTVVKPEKQHDADDSDDSDEEPEAKTVIWYQIRLPEGEVLRAGWVGAQQVQLDVPDEIMYLEGEGRRFTGWVVYDQTKTKKGELKENYVGLMKNLATEGPIDFTRIWVLTYAPEEGRYVNSYLEDALHGVLPVIPTTLSNGRKGFTIHELDEAGKQVLVEYEVNRTSPSRLTIKRLTPKIYYKKRR
ncbi:MAG TPA: SH3 domain-containing protein [Blastocatellia bacterium]|nr:SH3 domain-containing protein [Blastocatellia bacterium]